MPTKCSGWIRVGSTASMGRVGKRCKDHKVRCGGCDRIAGYYPLKGCAFRVLLSLAGLLASIGVAFALRRSSADGSGSLLVFSIGAGLLAWIAVAVSISAVKTWRERAAVIGGIAGEIPGDGPATIVGHIEAQGRLLEAPLSGKPCVAFTYEVYTMRGGPKGRSKMVCLDGIGLTASQIATRSGSFRLLAVPELDCEPEQLDIDLAVARANDRIRKLPLTLPRQPGSSPTIEAQWNDADGEFLRESNHVGEEVDATEYRFEESRIEPGTRVCVVGQFSSAQRAMVAAPDDWSKITRVMKGDPDAIVRRLTGSVVRRAIVGLACAALAIAIVAIH